MNNRLTRQSGVSLIEILVALLVLAIGLLGLAALQTTSLQLSGEAQARSQAILLANDYMDRIRTNRANASQYSVGSGDIGTCNPDINLGAQGDVAQTDQADWTNDVACLLPQGDARVQISSVGDRYDVAVTVSWEERTEEGAEMASVNFNTRL